MNQKKGFKPGLYLVSLLSLLALKRHAFVLSLLSLYPLGERQEIQGRN
jgi:hypothetical protein